MRYHRSNVNRSGIHRRYTVHRTAREAMEVGELARRWNDDEIDKYPVRIGNKVVDGPKEHWNSWMYEISIQPEGYKRVTRMVIEAVDQDHATAEAISRISEMAWTGKIPMAKRYFFTDFVRTNHRQSRDKGDI